MPRALARARRRLHAACADSFMTSPSWPVSVIWPLPGIRIASMNMMSPPTGVHASPVATPISGARPATSLCTFGWPAYFSRFLELTLTIFAPPQRRLSQHALNLALELADTGLARVLADQPLERAVADVRALGLLRLTESRFLELARQQIPLGDLQLFRRRVADECELLDRME